MPKRVLTIVHGPIGFEDNQGKLSHSTKACHMKKTENSSKFNQFALLRKSMISGHNNKKKLNSSDEITTHIIQSPDEAIWNKSQDMPSLPTIVIVNLNFAARFENMVSIQAWTEMFQFFFSFGFHFCWLLSKTNKWMPCICIYMHAWKNACTRAYVCMFTQKKEN